MDKKFFTKKNGMILGIVIIAIIAIWVFVLANSSETIDVKREIENIYKLEEQGDKSEAKKRFKKLMDEVDILKQSGKNEEAKRLFEQINNEINEQRKNKKSEAVKSKIFNFEGLDLTPRDDPAF